MRAPVLVAAALCALALTAAPAARAAGPTDAVDAEASFRSGLTYAEAERWEEALGRFEESLARQPSRAALMNAVLCLEKLGRFVDALAHVEAALARAKPEDRAPLEKKREGLRAHIGEIAIVGPRGEVFVDGVRAPAEGPILVNAGHHLVRALGPAGPTDHPVDVLGGAVARVSVASSSPVAAAASASSPPAGPGIARPLVAGGLVVGGGAALVVGALAARASDRALDDARSAAVGPCGRTCAEARYDDALAARTTSRVGLAVGVTLLAGGALTFALWPRGGVSPTGNGIALTGRF